MLRNETLFFGKMLQKNTALVRTGIGGALTHIAVIYKQLLSKNLDQNMLKNDLF